MQGLMALREEFGAAQPFEEQELRMSSHDEFINWGRF